MASIHLKIITPRKIVIDEEATSVTVPTTEGEISILPRHVHLLTLLTEGIITIKKNASEDSLAIGGGYLETNGKELKILVSRAYHQDEIDEEQTKRAIEEAKKIISEGRDESARHEAASIIRRSLVDMKLLKKKRRHTSL
ncbi:MAG: ATP synthase F1 subunit epsilon [Candidatus Roizmanbacteria bacterium]|nr:MAG: ATP synthase F1 subunit epsilon [Candidatus Roizmanbacteria bacterium]